MRGRRRPRRRRPTKAGRRPEPPWPCRPGLEDAGATARGDYRRVRHDPSADLAGTDVDLHRLTRQQRPRRKDRSTSTILVTAFNAPSTRTTRPSSVPPPDRRFNDAPWPTVTPPRCEGSIPTVTTIPPDRATVRIVAPAAVRSPCAHGHGGDDARKRCRDGMNRRPGALCPKRGQHCSGVGHRLVGLHQLIGCCELLR